MADDPYFRPAHNCKPPHVSSKSRWRCPECKKCWMMTVTHRYDEFYVGWVRVLEDWATPWVREAEE